MPMKTRVVLEEASTIFNFSASLSTINLIKYELQHLWRGGFGRYCWLQEVLGLSSVGLQETMSHWEK